MRGTRGSGWIAVFATAIWLADAALGIRTGVNPSPPLPVINVSSSPRNVILAVRSIAGLMNRQGPMAFVLGPDPQDAVWRDELLSDVPQQFVDPMDFISTGVQQFSVIVYSSDSWLSYPILPSVATMAGVLSSIPLDDDLLASFPNATISLDTRGLWSRAEEAVNYTIENALNQTTSLCFHSGIDVARGDLVDWIVARKLFTSYLNNSCIPFTEHNNIFKRLVHDSPWKRPIRVYGYNSQDLFLGGYLFEAETDCVRSMGQIATTGASNLAFWAQWEPFNTSAPQGSSDGPLTQPAFKRVPYDATKRYVSLVYGDMDNIGFVQTFGHAHMKYRAERCKNGGSGCFPFSWTMSPNMLDFGPAMMRWYYRKGAESNGQDWFVMPPSGTLYAYPGMMSRDVQRDFATQQNQQAYMMNTTGSVHWEWFYNWNPDFTEYFPLYIDADPGTRVFLLNEVPWVLPIPGLTAEGSYYKILGDASSPGSVVAFRPAFNWEPTGNGGVAINATQVAWLLNNFPPGSVQYIYIIQNTPIKDVFDMVSQLDFGVVLVSYEQAADLARQRGPV